MHEYDHKRATVRLSSLKSRCSSGKLRFRDHREAVDALHRIANKRDIAYSIDGFSSRREVRSYKCKACLGVHLTSRAAWTEKKVAA